jgi:hypothetical protein
MHDEMAKSVTLFTLPLGGGKAIISGAKKESLAEEKKPFTIHGLLMWTSWFLIGLFMIITNRWFTYWTNKSNYIHAALGYTVVLLNLIAVYTLATTKYGFKSLLEETHGILGLTCVIGLLFFAMTGTATFLLKRKLFLGASNDNRLIWQTKMVMRVRRVHKFLALFFWAFSLVIMSYGIFDYFDSGFTSVD